MELHSHHIREDKKEREAVSLRGRRFPPGFPLAIERCKLGG